MRFPSPVLGGCALVLGLCLSLTGCERTPTEGPAPSLTPVTVSYAIEKEVADYADFTARTAAVDSVEVRARVWGYLDKVNFKEGALVEKDDVLFEIDPRTYRAALAQAEGNLTSMQARLTRLDADLARARRLVGTGSIGREEYDKIAGDRGEAAASLQALRATVHLAKLDLGYTKVIAPISGRVSRYVVTQGNLVQSGQNGGGTLLTTLVSVDPMYAYFDADERTVLRVQRLIREGKVKSARDNGVEIPVFLGLADETGHPHRGTVNFVDNQVNPRTGTLRMRGVFSNKNDLLYPGLFARIRMHVGEPRRAVLVSERAIDTDQGQKVLYVVNDKNEVMSRPVRVGGRHDGLRVIEDGLKPGEWVIVNGLQQVRPGATVEPKFVDMPGAPAVHSSVAAANAPRSEKP